MKLRYKFLLIFLVLVLLITITNCQSISYADNLTDNSISNYTVPSQNNLSLYSEAGILIDSKTGKVLYGKNENVKMFPASTTKILTAIITIENCNLSDKVTASREAIISIPPGYSNAEIQPNDTISVQDLLNVFLIHSANEAGYILAEHISGSIENFANLMNEKAKEIGCTNTHFTNPSGIHNENHYSTAYDMSLIAQYCMKNETFRKIVSTPYITFSPSEGKQLKFYNTNDLIINTSKYYYKYAIGIKTGYTSQAKNCLISASSKDGLELIAVILGAAHSEEVSSTRYVDTINLFNYGFDNYKSTEILARNSVIKNVEVENATKDTKDLSLLAKDTISVLVPKNINIDTLEPSIEINNLSAPISEGAVVGKITYNINGENYSTDLVAGNSIIRSDIKTLIVQIVLAILFLCILTKLLKKKK
mgnify:FL=1